MREMREGRGGGFAGFRSTWSFDASGHFTYVVLGTCAAVAVDKEHEGACHSGKHTLIRVRLEQEGEGVAVADEAHRRILFVARGTVEGWWRTEAQNRWRAAATYQNRHRGVCVRGRVGRTAAALSLGVALLALGRTAD